MHRSYKIFMLSLIMINIFNLLGMVDFKLGIPLFVKYFFSILVLLAIVYTRLANPTKPDQGLLVNAVIIIFIVYSLILSVLAILKIDSLFYVQRILAQRYFFMPYLIPVFLLYTKFDLNFFRFVLYYSCILVIPGIIVQLFIFFTGGSPLYWENFAYVGIFNMANILLLLTAHYIENKFISVLAFIYVFLMLILNMIVGVRGASIEYMMLIMFMIILRLNSPIIKRIERMKIYLFIWVFVIFIIAFSYVISSSNAFERGFSKEAFLESRGQVTEDFFTDFYRTSEWIFGRGLDSSILRTINVAGQMDTIEQGIMTALLKGGLLYVIPFTIILLRAAYLGFFRSNNDLSKAMAAIILVHFIIMFVFNLPDYSSKYILFWISIADV